MKRSELKQTIKEEIKSILSEEAEMSDLAKVKAEITKHLTMYQDAEGDMAKKSAVEMLKKLNVEKKRLEAEEIEKASSIGIDQELDYDSED